MRRRVGLVDHRHSVKDELVLVDMELGIGIAEKPSLNVYLVKSNYGASFWAINLTLVRTSGSSDSTDAIRATARVRYNFETNININRLLCQGHFKIRGKYSVNND